MGVLWHGAPRMSRTERIGLGSRAIRCCLKSRPSVLKKHMLIRLLDTGRKTPLRKAGKQEFRGQITRFSCLPAFLISFLSGNRTCRKKQHNARHIKRLSGECGRARPTQRGQSSAAARGGSACGAGDGCGA